MPPIFFFKKCLTDYDYSSNIITVVQLKIKGVAKWQKTRSLLAV